MLQSEYEMNSIATGVIGLGAMGAPMATHIAEQGLLAAVWNRSTHKAVELAQQLGVSAAESPQALAGMCNVILTCVSADADLVSVIKQLLPGIQPGSVIIDTSTVSPTTARDMAKLLETEGAGFIDAPVSGGVEGAKCGTLSVMAGGDSATLSRIRPVLDSISARVVHMGEVGNGQATKAVNQVIVAGIAGTVCEALAFSEKLNLPSERLLPVLGAGAAGSWFLEHRGQTMLKDEFDVGFKLSLLLKDLHICRELARDLDINTPVVDAAIRDYTELVELGDGDNDISGLIRLRRQ
jgi:3-hydroxyisobutyrate dehydrogenase